MRIFLLGTIRNVRIRWRRGHQCVSTDRFLGVVGSYHEKLHVIHARALEAGRRGRQNKVSKGKENENVREDEKKIKECGISKANRRIIVGVEEKDRAFGRTLKRSLSRSDHSQARFVASLADGFAAVVTESTAADPCHHAK